MNCSSLLDPLISGLLLESSQSFLGLLGSQIRLGVFVWADGEEAVIFLHCSSKLLCTSWQEAFCTEHP